MKIFSKNKFIIFIIFLFAFLLRLYALNWDTNNHLHPDERFLTMLVTDISLPTSISQYFNTSTSPLNPYNYPSYQFFVYGTFPIFLIKTLAVLFHFDNYDQITLLGRVVSAFFDASNIVLLYFIAKKFLKSFYKFIPSIFYSLLVLPIQLSHFFAVDTFLNFFLLLTFTLLSYNFFALAFLIFGLALACKISALYFVPVIFLFILKKFLSSKNKLSLLLLTVYYSLLTILAFRVFQPYSFVNNIDINPQFIGSLKSLASYSNPDVYYPPGVQWINRLTLLNSFKNTGIWGLGLFFSLPFIILLFKLFTKVKIKFNLLFLISVWAIFLFVFQSLQFVHAMRYQFIIYPFLCLILSALLFNFKIDKKIIIVLLILNSFYTFAFLSIYSLPNSRVQASEWIKENISTDKVISNEYWDDALPLGFSPYQSETLAFFDPETSEKWEKINQSLEKIDFMIMSSNRLWASIPRVPEKYPQASKFYADLFSGNSNFSLVKKITSYPGFPIAFLKSCFYFGPSNYPGVKNTWFERDDTCSYPGLYFRDDSAEEAFTVYDHPQVLIFSKHK